MGFKWSPFTEKQLKLLNWWTEKSPWKKASGIIAEGAVRSGKTLLMSFSFVCWSMTTSSGQQYILGGKTVGSLRRNVITPLKQVLRARGFKLVDNKTDNSIIISKNGISNTYYLFGGRDERSQDLVQGITARGIFLDEVALMPRSFVEQCMARCSVEGRKFWFNCNPEGPHHWFYLEHILRAKELGYLVLHFNLEDNPSLSKEIIEGYKHMFTGIFYKRFILGEWAFSDGVIYDCYDEERNTFTDETADEVLPWQIKENDPDGGYPYYTSDYGVLNPMVYLEMYKIRETGDSVPHFYFTNEYYYDGRKEMKQKTDEEEVDALMGMINNKYYNTLIIDPSASSLIAASRKRGIPTKKANNDVLDGIHMVYTLMATGHIHINKDRCPNLIRELGLYIWNEKRGEIGKEEPVKQNDHAMDAMRYGIATTTNKFEIYQGLEKSGNI